MSTKKDQVCLQHFKEPLIDKEDMKEIIKMNALIVRENCRILKIMSMPPFISIDPGFSQEGKGAADV